MDPEVQKALHDKIQADRRISRSEATTAFLHKQQAADVEPLVKKLK